MRVIFDVIDRFDGNYSEFFNFGIEFNLIIQCGEDIRRPDKFLLYCLWSGLGVSTPSRPDGQNAKTKSNE